MYYEYSGYLSLGPGPLLYTLKAPINTLRILPFFVCVCVCAISVHTREGLIEAMATYAFILYEYMYIHVWNLFLPIQSCKTIMIEREVPYRESENNCRVARKSQRITAE